MSQQKFFDNNNHFVISYELLQLLLWLLDHEQESLKKLIYKALGHGLEKKLRMLKGHSSTPEHQAPQELQQSIIDFFSLLELLMIETMDEHTFDDVMQRSMLPEIDNIDTHMYESDTIHSSIAKATSAAKNNKGESPKDVLYKELLKRWKPAKKSILH
ncbi:MAG: hypothetical protein WC707_02080 [Candidatus Babeliaceae bacterium]|jgi:hypothetical protein